MNEYTFWRLLKAQWSFKNDLPWIGVTIILATLYSCLVLESATEDSIPMSIYIVVIGMYTVIWTSIYHLIKLVMVLLYCYALTSTIKNDSGMYGLQHYIALYNEALTWRK